MTPVRKLVPLLLPAALVFGACNKPADSTTDSTTPAVAGSASAPVVVKGLESDEKKFGYAVGVNIAHSLQPVKDDIDLKALESGLEDAYAGSTLKLDEKTRGDIMKSMSERIRAEQTAKREEEGKKAKEAGEKFLAENAKKDGVKTTADGLEYEVLTEGTGASPTASDEVTVNYKGTLIDGTTFDSSYDRGQPATFPVANVIPGWTEGLQLMKVGGKYKLFIPSELGYKDHGAPPKIGPNETLIFEVELLDVKKGATPAKPPMPAKPMPMPKKPG